LIIVITYQLARGGVGLLLVYCGHIILLNADLLDELDA
jgi:hypothetical protein